METLHSHHVSTFIFIFSLYIPFLSLANDIITPIQPLTINQTLVSSGEVFELGFFDLRNDNNLYLGIWYRQIQPRTYVWLANRDAPITSSFAKLTIGGDGNISLVDRAEAAVWSSNRSTMAVDTVAQLLDSGNFVVRREDDENPENYVWQSFDYPTDTLLPGMKLGLSRTTGIDRVMKSWKADNDPGSGDYSYRININGFPEFVFLNKETVIYRSGPWNGIAFSGTPEMKGVSMIQFEFHNTFDEIYFSYEMVNSSVYSRLLVNSAGYLQRFIWTANAETWSLYWQFPRERCDNYGQCGRFGVCDMNSFPICNCLNGFRPRDEYAWFKLQHGSNGCVRSSKLDCGSDGFLPLKNVKLPEGSKAFIDRSMNLSECGEICKRNCACMAYANMDVTRGGAGCAIWAVDLMDMKQYAGYEGGGQDLYVRVAASDLGQSPTTINSKNGNNVVKIVGITVGICAGLITLLILVYLKRKNMRWSKKSITYRIGLQESIEGETKMDELDLPLFDFTTLAIATNNFSDANKLGQGGFGCVYKVAETRLATIVELS
ncbi:hypothetical protein L6452_35380 [Arctium lappa]|uniref:Uncharacterized protein n=1 Tax=Arctium lappa TaxID=4217 RepID=A0ACB8Y5J9_ARCLA|nr:hypothetical protein L6452_35380 [Arctium lappa]